MRNILVTGGAGYIGSHMVRLLDRRGFHPIILDDLSSGHREAIQVGSFVEGNIADTTLVAQLYEKYSFEGVINLASFIAVGESMVNPAKYYENNIQHTLAFLNGLIRLPLKYFIFSSTAAIFGNPEYTPLDEKHPHQPVSVYGHTKLMIEQVLNDYANAYEFNYGTLRYFNAAGADHSGEIGECHNPETHLIPLILQAISGRRSHISVFGDDYATPDGTCIRDYIHVNDLCQAHIDLVDYLCAGGKERQFNLGTGHGYSVNEVIRKAEEVTGKPVPVEYAERRPGDAAILIADGSKAKQLLGWSPQYSDLSTIIRDAWHFEQKHFAIV